MRRAALALLVTAACALLVTAACAAPAPRPSPGDVDGLKTYAHARVSEEMKRTGADSVAVVVVDKQGIAWSEMFGAATLDKKMRVGSLSKLMTSLAVLSLRDDKKLDIDAPVTDVIPWFSVRHRFETGPVTARSLMTHHSGLPSNILKGMYGTSRTFIDHVKALADEDMVSPARTKHDYSDAGYTVLGAVVEAAGGAPFADVVDARVFKPFGMTSSSFVQTRDVMPAFVDGAPLVENPPATVPANGLVTTPRDLAKVAQALLTGGDSRIADVLEPHDDTALDLDFRTGFGFNENSAFADVPIWWHSGQTLAFTAELVVCPAKNIAVIVMTNTREAGMLPSIVAWDVMGAAVGARVEPPVPSSSFTNAELDADAGTYPTEYGAISLARDGGTLRGRAFDEAFELVPTSRRTFVPYILVAGAVPFQPDLLHGIELSFDVVDGKRALISHQRGLRFLRGVRVAPVPLSAAWLARVGHWQNPERGDDQITVDGAELSVEDGFLMARVHITHSPKPFLVPLVPIDDDTAVTAGVGRYLGETMRVTHEGGAERLHVVGYALSR